MHNQEPARHADSARSATAQAPADSEEPQLIPAITALLIAIVVAASRWLEWLLYSVVPIVTSPRFISAIKEAGIATAPVLQKVAKDVWTWYTNPHGPKLSNVSPSQHTVAYNTTQSLSFGVSMPGVSINMQYQATSTPGAPAVPAQEATNLQGLSTASLESNRRAIEPAPVSPLSAETAQSHTLLGRARNSVAAVSSLSSLPMQTLARLPAYSPLHPVRMCTGIWELAKPTQGKAVPAT